MTVFRKLMVANRGEIAIRVFRSAHELGIRTVAVYSHEDRFALHRLKADEAYQVGKAGVPILAGSDSPVLPGPGAHEVAGALGYPLIVKAALGGGGRGMRVVESADALDLALDQARSEAQNAFGCPDVFLEKFIRRAKHIEVQLLGDRHGHLVHLHERDCSIQRRHQKVIEIAPASNLDAFVRDAICQAALAIGRKVGYENAGTVEFLVDDESGTFCFIEVNPRLQVEHTITEIVTGIDIVKSQILIAQGCDLADPDIGIGGQESIEAQGHAIQCRITSEDPTNNFTPDYGRITHYRSSGGPGPRLDGGSTTTGAIITPFYDSLLVKISAYARRFKDAAMRMKMETTLYAERPARVAEVIAMVGLQVKAGDLLLKLTSE